MSKCRLNAIMAVADDGAIGRNNALPWRLRSDLQLFKAVTAGSPLIMGSRTFDSLPGILPGRPHLVVSSRPRLHEHAQFFRSFEEVCDYVCGAYEEAFVVGGAGVYNHFFAEDLLDRVYVTHVHASVPDADTRVDFNALLGSNSWSESNRVDFPQDAHNDHPFTFTVLNRNR
jgi:dihydrofolate reductase